MFFRVILKLCLTSISIASPYLCHREGSQLRLQALEI